MDVKKHWDKVYATKAPESVSWYRAQLETSLALIERAAVARSASIIDIGGGESTLVDDLTRHFRRLPIPSATRRSRQGNQRGRLYPESSV